MSVYSVKGRGWRYDFTTKGQRHTEAWFKTKREATKAENERRKEAERPPEPQAPIDMDFLSLVNRWLDFLKDYRSEKHYKDCRYNARRWAERWGELRCAELAQTEIEKFIRERKRKGSAATANKDIRYLRAVFNFGRKKMLVKHSPLDGIECFPVDKNVRYVPLPEEIDRVIAVASTDPWLSERRPDTVDYLITLRDTLGRMSEINRLEWGRDVKLEDRYLVLYTRKITGGLTPRQVPMTDRLHQLLSRRCAERDPSKPWVFWNHRTGRPYIDRKKIMRRLCEKAEVPYFRFHALRHSGASLMDAHNVSRGSIQRILGHRSQKTTELYLHSLGNSEREAMEIFEEITKKSLTQSLTQVRRSGLDRMV